MASPETLADWKEAKPFIRSLAAFALIYRLGFPHGTFRDETIQEAYSAADCFIAQLEKDLQS
jgi:hypothetical protein